MTIDKINYILGYFSHLLNKEQRLILNKLHNVQAYNNLIIKLDEEKVKVKVLNDLELTLTDLVDYSPDRLNYFREKIACEILEIHSNEIKFNVCPICGELARTPVSRQAKCGHTW